MMFVVSVSFSDVKMQVIMAQLGLYQDFFR